MMQPIVFTDLQVAIHVLAATGCRKKKKSLVSGCGSI